VPLHQQPRQRFDDDDREGFPETGRASGATASPAQPPPSRRPLIGDGWLGRCGRSGRFSLAGLPHWVLQITGCGTSLPVGHRECRGGMLTDMRCTRWSIVVPVKTLIRAKTRLAAAAGPYRADLAAAVA